jgi:superfamily II DNA/RNA helicase
LTIFFTPQKHRKTMTEEILTTFAELELDPAINKVIKEVGYETPSPIQARSIPPLLEGRDLLGQAQTGTGKTAAFALPLLSRSNCASYIAASTLWSELRDASRTTCAAEP